jgi:hypothetical protein
MKRPRLRKWAKWACTLGAVVAVGVAAFSGFYSCSYGCVRKKGLSLRWVWLGAGQVGAWDESIPLGMSFPQEPRWKVVQRIRWRWGFKEVPGLPGSDADWHAGVLYGRSPHGNFYGVNLAYPVLLTTIPAALLWYADRRRFGPGACGGCGYDRLGLASDAACPECGTVPPPAS